METLSVLYHHNHHQTTGLAPSQQWHHGEQAVHRLLHVPPRDRNPTHRGYLPPFLAQRVAESPLVAWGALDHRGRPWVTVWGGEKGFCGPVGEPDDDILGLRTRVWVASSERQAGGEGGRGERGEQQQQQIYDPVVWALMSSSLGKEEVEEESGGKKTRGRLIHHDGRVISPHDDNNIKVMAGLSIDLETRDRVKLAGTMVAGMLSTTTEGGEEQELQLAVHVNESLGNCPKYLNKKRIYPMELRPRLEEEEEEEEEEDGDEDEEEGGVMRSKKRNKKPLAVRMLPRGAAALIKKADLFFIASKHVDREGTATTTTSMDVNHRGGNPGFLQIVRGDPEEEGEGGKEEEEEKYAAPLLPPPPPTPISLIYPEYSGNRLYQTLGNLHDDPEVGLVIPDFETGDVLYMTGKATLLFPSSSSSSGRNERNKNKLAVRIDVDEYRFVREGLGFRGEWIDWSVYNPRVDKKKMTTMGKEEGEEEENEGGGRMTATLLRKEVITRSISRYTFKLTTTTTTTPSESSMTEKKMKAWTPGQHVTLDFGEELSGKREWRHMDDGDPQSLNDDFVRTFTVSRPVDEEDLLMVVDGGGGGGEEGERIRYFRPDVEPEMEITVRRNGPATGLLSSSSRADGSLPLRLPVLGFGGSEGFHVPPLLPRRTDDDDDDGGEKEHVFVAAGVGITPMLAQAAARAKAGAAGRESMRGLRLLWSLRAEDVGFAVDVMGRIPGLADVTELFVTGGMSGDGGNMGELNKLAVTMPVKRRRMAKVDVLAAGREARGGRKYYCCTGPEMMKRLLEWTEGEEVVFENFEY